MFEPSAQAGAPQAATGKQGLWDKAPAWRNLVVTAVLLTAAAIALPLALPTPVVNNIATNAPQTTPVQSSSPAPVPAGSQPQACLLTQSPAPTSFGAGTIISTEDQAVSLARIKLTESHMGGQIDPAYIDNQRVTVRLGNGRYAVFIVPKAMQVHLGDRVRVQNGYRNVNLPCNYVPNLITADMGPAPDAGTAGPPPTRPLR